jgi:glycosyltransferase involved in cell wall biosynthesis
VLHLIDALGVGGGAEHSLVAILSELEQRNVRCSVATLIHRVGGLQEQVKREGYSIAVLGGPTWLHNVLRLRRLLKRTRPDILHSTLFKSGLVARLAVQGLKVTLVESLVSTPYDIEVVSHGSVPRWKISVVRRVDATTARIAGGQFHAVSDTVMEHARRTLGMPENRIVVISRGRRGDDYPTPSRGLRARAREAEGIPDQSVVFLNVGRQDPVKSQEDLIYSFADVVATNPATLLFVAGRAGSETQAIEHAVASSQLEESVRLLGHRTDLKSLYAAADVFVLPSLSEGAAGAMLEAMAMGLPIVASDAAAFREILQNGKYGLIAERRDRAALAAAMGEFARNSEARAVYGEFAKQRFDERYELASVANAMADYYRRLIQA